MIAQLGHAVTFHQYSPSPQPAPPPPSTTTRPHRPPAPFPTFLYANEPPPPTARNKQRLRPSPAQLADLKSLYARTAHPTREERETLGRRIGMPYQSVTNWFQNQRSTARKQRSSSTPPLAQSQSEPELLSTLVVQPATSTAPPLPRQPARRVDPVRDIIAHSSRPSRSISAPSSPPSISTPAITTPPPAVAAPAPTPAPTTSLFSITPTTPAASSSSSSFFQLPRAPTPPIQAELISQSYTPLSQNLRGKRSRPTPQQLVVLRALHAATTSPSIEERVRVGREIGMDLGKVTNWFRNLRQTARKKEKIARLERSGSAGGGVDTVELMSTTSSGSGEGNNKRAKRSGTSSVFEEADTPGHKRPRLRDAVFEEEEEGDGVSWGEYGEDDEMEVSGAASVSASVPVSDTEDSDDVDVPHEAVTPEPAHGDGQEGKRGGAVSMDDALLLLALHDAR